VDSKGKKRKREEDKRDKYLECGSARGKHKHVPKIEASIRSSPTDVGCVGPLGIRDTLKMKD